MVTLPTNVLLKYKKQDFFDSKGTVMNREIFCIFAVSNVLGFLVDNTVAFFL